MQQMKQVAQAGVYRPHINNDIKQMGRTCMHSICREPKQPPKTSKSPMHVAWEALEPTASQSHHQLPWNQLASTGGRLLQVPLLPANQFHFNQGNNRPAEARFCSLWLSTYAGDG